MVRNVVESDLASWKAIAKEVEDLFGPMVETEGFEDAIKQCIAEENAFGIEDGDGSIAGIIAVDRGKNEIIWLAVRKGCRGNNYGGQLLEKALAELNKDRPIFVQTFASTVDEGASARRLYLKYGFSDEKSVGKNPAGLDTVMMVRETLGT